MPFLKAKVHQSYGRCRHKPDSLPGKSDFEWRQSHVNAMDYFLSLDGLSVSPSALHSTWAPPTGDWSDWKPPELWQFLSQVTFRQDLNGLFPMQAEQDAYLASLRLEAFDLDIVILAVRAPAPRLALLWAEAIDQGATVVQSLITKENYPKIAKIIQEIMNLPDAD